MKVSDEMNNNNDKIQELIDRKEIYEVLVRYCQGVDRGDVELLKSVYHEDAQDDHGMFKGKGVDFAEWIVCLLYTSPSPRDRQKSRMPSSA